MLLDQGNVFISEIVSSYSRKCCHMYKGVFVELGVCGVYVKQSVSCLKFIQSLVSVVSMTAARIRI